MRRAVLFGSGFCIGFTGCASLPPVDNPALIRPGQEDVENPVLVSPGLPTPAGYAEVYEKSLDALDDYFEIKPGSRYSGQIVTLPRIAPGYEQPWKGGSPDRRERLLATFQTVRHYAIVRISAGERGGYRVAVEVHKEIEDIQQPTGAIAGAASFRESTTVDRKTEVVAAEAPSNKSWIPSGRDPAFEQIILRKIQYACR